MAKQRLNIELPPFCALCMAEPEVYVEIFDTDSNTLTKPIYLSVPLCKQCKAKRRFLFPATLLGILCAIAFMQLAFALQDTSLPESQRQIDINLYFLFIYLYFLCLLYFDSKVPFIRKGRLIQFKNPSYHKLFMEYYPDIAIPLTSSDPL